MMAACRRLCWPTTPATKRDRPVEIIELRGSAQQQRLGDPRLEVSVTAFDGAVLVRDATVVAGGTMPKWTTSASKRRVRSSASGKARLRKAAERLSLRCSRGTPPSRRSAFSSPPARAG